MAEELTSPAVLFVCLGNICRSPTAHGVFRHLLEQHDLTERIAIDSAGTGDWHIGKPPDERARAAAKTRGYDIEDLRARRVCEEDFYQFDYLLAMDAQNLRDLEYLCPADANPRIELFLDYAQGSDVREVPDPYNRQADGFETVLGMVEDASQGLLRALSERHL